MKSGGFNDCINFIKGKGLKDYFRNVLTSCQHSWQWTFRYRTAKCAKNSLLHSTRVTNYATTDLSYKGVTYEKV